MDWQALALTLRLATITTAILLVVSVPLSALLILGRSRWLAILEALATLPLVLPPTVLGFFLWFFSARAHPLVEELSRCSATRSLSLFRDWL
jgi:ABC-type molybdate transport system permease subunit